MNDNIFGLADSREQAHTAIEALKSAGFRDDQVSFVLMETSASNEVDNSPALPTYQNRTAGAMTLGGITGTSVGAALGWAATLGVAGPLVVAGPLLAIIGGAVAGGATGGLLGATLGATKQKSDAEHKEVSARIKSEREEKGEHDYAEHLQRGGVLIVAHPHNRNQLATVHQVFNTHGISIPERELNVS